MFWTDPSFHRFFRIPRSKGPLVWNHLNLDHSHSSVQQTKVCFLSTKQVDVSGGLLPPFGVALSGAKVAQSSFSHFTEKTYHAFRVELQASFSRLRTVYKQAKYAQQDRKRYDKVLIRKTLLLLGNAARASV